MAHLQLRSATNRFAVPASSRSRTVVVRAAKAEDHVKPAPAFLAAAVTASMLMGAQLVTPDDAYAAKTAGRASASKFRSQRRSAISESAAPQVNNYSSTTIVAAPPVYSPPAFGISIVPVIPIPLPNPFGYSAPAPVSTAAADAAAATASAEAAAAAATAAAAAATAAAAVAVLAK